MFQKTRIRLAALNTLILFLIINLFGVVLYMYTYNRLYKRVDISLLSTASRLQHEQFRDIYREKGYGRIVDRRIAYLIWSNDGQLLSQVPQEAFFSNDIEKLRPAEDESGIRTISTSDGHKYRSLVFRALPEEILRYGPSPTPSGPVATVQLLLNVDPESDMLSYLIVIVIIGGLTGGLVSLFAGLFLANRALIPIKESWDKQQQFVADASHELRTPLSVIQGQLELLFRHPDHTIEQDSVRISAVLTEVKRMGKMVSQLLTLARSESNQIELEHKDFTLDQLIKTTAEQFKPLAETKQISLETVLEGDINVCGDEERLQQLFIILLDNALKYTPEGGTIKVISRKFRNEVQVVVEDTGIGIPEENLPFIFDRFYRGDKARSRTGGGTGLGLAIAKWIVQVHHGFIWAESKLAQGTKIHISLPMKRGK